MHNPARGIVFVVVALASVCLAAGQGRAVERSPSPGAGSQRQRELETTKARKDAQRYGAGAIVSRHTSASGRIKETLVTRPNGETTSVRRVVHVGPTGRAINTTREVTDADGALLRSESSRVVVTSQGGGRTDWHAFRDSRGRDGGVKSTSGRRSVRGDGTTVPGEHYNSAAER